MADPLDRPVVRPVAGRVTGPVAEDGCRMAWDGWREMSAGCRSMGSTGGEKPDGIRRASRAPA
ncbi:hypothetical protein, partial [Streptomyces odontomachi]|uniref:hypothetical protein n=1 Tax=Streptomyces odontomachi TaxID=2944940 RepID=UPI002109A4CE